ncbi:MAG: acyl-CoA dehydrogenase family protein [Vicinamibacterales bacterium]
MTFDLTPEQLALVAQAATLTSLPANVLDAVLVVEERARQQSAADAPFGYEGEANPIRARMIAAAAGLGIGRAAVAHALAFMKANDVKAGPDTTVPHWAFADGATEVEAARLLTYAAAKAVDRGEPSETLVARVLDFATRAAQRAVDAAIRVEGAADYSQGSLLERLLRDARTLQVILR